VFYEKVHDLNFGWHGTCGAGRAFPLGLLSCGVDVQGGFSEMCVFGRNLIFDRSQYLYFEVIFRSKRSFWVIFWVK